jgi:hypothetical protein
MEFAAKRGRTRGQFDAWSMRQREIKIEHTILTDKNQ